MRLFVTLLAGFLSLAAQGRQVTTVSVVVQRPETAAVYALSTFSWSTLSLPPLPPRTTPLQTAQLMGNPTTLTTWDPGDGTHRSVLSGTGTWRDPITATTKVVTYKLWLTRLASGTEGRLNLTVTDPVSKATLFASGSLDTLCTVVYPDLLANRTGWRGLDVTVSR